MSRLTEQELTEILDENKGISMVNPNRVYPPLPPAETITVFLYSAALSAEPVRVTESPVHNPLL